MARANDPRQKCFLTLLPSVCPPIVSIVSHRYACMPQPATRYLDVVPHPLIRAEMSRRAQELLDSSVALGHVPCRVIPSCPETPDCTFAVELVRALLNAGDAHGARMLERDWAGLVRPLN